MVWFSKVRISSYLTGPFLTLPFLDDDLVVAGDVGLLLLDVDLQRCGYELLVQIFVKYLC